jgi:uncharacterized protein (TIGR00297 family)
VIIAWSIALAAALSVAGRAARWLTLDGMIAATFVGGGVFAGSGWRGGLLLAIFFVSGSALTQLSRRRGLASSDSPKGARNARQVLANGLWATFGALLVPWRPGEGWAILTGGLAAAQADTWATEVGATAKSPPRLLTTWAAVPRGTSGAVTPRGTLGGALGGALTALAAMAAGIAPRIAAAALAGGLLGMAADSLLGATVQARFHCDVCDRGTERPRHCDSRTRYVTGWSWLDNDGVNLLATLIGSLTALAVVRL